MWILPWEDSMGEGPETRPELRLRGYQRLTPLTSASHCRRQNWPQPGLLNLKNKKYSKFSRETLDWSINSLTWVTILCLNNFWHFIVTGTMVNSQLIFLLHFPPLSLLLRVLRVVYLSQESNCTPSLIKIL